MASHQLTLVLIITHIIICSMSVTCTTFTMINKCDYTVWPGILSNADSPALSTTGFPLEKGETKTLNAPASWGGRMWARTLCSQDSATGKFTCITGDCGDKLECSGSGATPPATLAEFKLDGYGGQDYYDVSLVDRYNLPMLVVPQGGDGPNCTSTGCVVDLNPACPSELKVMSEDAAARGVGVACKSACVAFREPEYCCNGAYSTPDTCKPSTYSQIFKTACPHAYSYAYDDKTSTFTCGSGPDYTITFCPSPNTSQKSSQGKSSGSGSETGANAGLIDSTMVYEGALGQSSGSPSTWNHVLGSHGNGGIVGVVSITLAIWRLWQVGNSFNFVHISLT